MKKENLSIFYAGLAIFFWSTVASVYKIALRTLTPIQLIFQMILFSLIVLFLIVLYQKKIKLLAQTTKKDILHSAFSGLLNPFLFYVILFQAYSLLPAQEAQTIFYSWPAILIIFSVIFLKQKIKVANLFAIIVSFIGVGIICTHGDLLSFYISNIKGAGLAFGSALVWAAFWIIDVKDNRDSTIKLFLNAVFSLIYITITILIFSEIELPINKTLLSSIYLGLFDISITFVFWSLALKLTKSTIIVSKFIYLVPFLSLIFINLILKEKILSSTFIGLCFIVTGILIEQFCEWNNNES